MKDFFFLKKVVIRFFLAWLVLTLSITTMFAQQGGEQKIPDGKWILESVSIIEKDAPVPFNVDKLGYGVPAGIEIQQDKITLVWNVERVTLDYSVVVKEIYLCFSVCARWKIIEDSKLELQWEDDQTGIILLTYKQN